MRSLVIEAHSVLGAIRFFTLVELMIQGNNRPSTMTQRSDFICNVSYMGLWDSSVGMLQMYWVGWGLKDE